MTSGIDRQVGSLAHFILAIRPVTGVGFPRAMVTSILGQDGLDNAVAAHC